MVELLASPEFGGRRGAGGDKASAYLDRTIPAAQARATVPGRIHPAGSRPGAWHGHRPERRSDLAGLRPVITRPVGDRVGSFRPPGCPGRQALSRCRRQCFGSRHDARSGPSRGPRAVATEAKHHVHRLRPRGGRPVRVALLRGASAGPARQSRPVHHRRHDRPGTGRGLRIARLRDGHRTLPRDSDPGSSTPRAIVL